MKNILFLSVILFLLCQKSGTAQTKSDTTWAKWSYLLGDWQGEGTGDPGKGTGGFSFKADLDKKILVRKNYAEYPATKDKPAFKHEDLLIVYAEKPGVASRAIYFDNEGHVINYSIQFSQDGKSIVFLSDVIAGAPRFRLTYTQMEINRLGITFEFAPPGQPDAFAPYIQATAKKKKK